MTTSKSVSQMFIINKMMWKYEKIWPHFPHVKRPFRENKVRRGHRYLRKVGCSRHIILQNIHFNLSASSRDWPNKADVAGSMSSLPKQSRRKKFCSTDSMTNDLLLWCIPFRNRLVHLPQNVGGLANTLAYYHSAKITAAKRFIEQTQ
jgi:hypothetical protein